MHRKVRPDNWWMIDPRNTPHHPDTHLVEREQALRHIRRHRLPGEPSGNTQVLINRPADDLLAALRLLVDSLEKDCDSFRAWSGLSIVFEAMDDRERSGRCRNIARWLVEAPLAKGTARG